MCQRQDWKCATPKCDGKPEIAEHTIPVAVGNTEKPDCLLCGKCAGEKTAVDRRDIARAKRRRRYHEEGRGRKRKGKKMESRSQWPKRKFAKRGPAHPPHEEKST